MSKGARKEQGADVSLAMKVVNVLFAIALVMGLSPTFQAFGQSEDTLDVAEQVTEQAASGQENAEDPEGSEDMDGVKDAKASTASDQDDSKVKSSSSAKGKTSGSSKNESVAAQS